MPKVSVIINCLNGENFVRQAIQSVYDQTCQDWEIIFWDNASTDSTPDIARSFADGRLRYFRSRETVPLGTARQWAMAEARGEWLAILDHDDLFLPRRLERQLAELAKDDYVFCYAGYREVDEGGRLLRSVVPRFRSGDVLNDLLSDFECNIVTAMMRRDVLTVMKVDTISGFAMADEYYLYLGLAGRGKVCVVPEVLAVYRHVGSSWTNRVASEHSREFHAVLDQIEREFPQRRAQIAEGMRAARAKADYAQAKYLMSAGRHAEARHIMASIRPIRKIYALLWLASHFPPLWNLLHRRDLKVRLTGLFLRR
jgi:glycosyltransferase involved in cell wall biosynthesis